MTTPLHLKFAETDAQQRMRELRAKYALVFGGDTGSEVLADILRDLGVLGDLDSHNPAVNALRNYAETALKNKAGKTAFLNAIRLLIPEEKDAG